MFVYSDVTTRPNGTLVKAWTSEDGGAYFDGVRRELGVLGMYASIAASPTQVLLVAKSHATGALIGLFDDGTPINFGGFVFEYGPHVCWTPRWGFVVAWQDSKFTWRWRRLSDRLEQPLTLPTDIFVDGSSQGMLDVAVTSRPDDAGADTMVVTPRWNLNQTLTVSGVSLALPKKVGDWWLGQASIGLLGGIAAVNAVTGEKKNVAAIPTQAPVRAAMDGAGVIHTAIAFTADPSVGLFIPQSAWTAYDPLPPMVMPDSPRPGDIVNAGAGHLVWERDIEGSYWAYDLWIAGKPARFLFHDLRTPLDAQFSRRVNGVDVPLVHEGEPVSTAWLAQKTGATIVAYHDENVDTTVPANHIAFRRRLELLDAWRQRGYGIVYGLQGYPRIVAGTTLDETDALWCLEKGLERCANPQFEMDEAESVTPIAPFPAWVFLAVWQGNRVGADAHLAYPEGTLTRIWIGAARLRPRYAILRGLVGFGDGRNDVSAWCVSYRAKLGQLTPVSTEPYPRTAIPEPPKPISCQLSDEDDVDDWTTVNDKTEQRVRRRRVLVAPANGGAPCGPLERIETRPRQKGGGGRSKPLTKKQKQVAGAAAAGGGLVVLLGKLFHWW